MPFQIYLLTKIEGNLSAALYAIKVVTVNLY